MYAIPLCPTLGSLTDAAQYHPVTAPTGIITLGYYVMGDAGGGHYKYAATEPSHLGKLSITLAGGATAWFELVDHVVNPKQFGAVGDGVAIDTAALRSCIQFGKVVFLLSFQYLVDAHIAVPDGRIVKGAGRENTRVFRAANDTTKETITDSDGTTYAGCNTLFFIESGGQGTTLTDLRYSGCDDATDGTTLVQFGNNCRQVNLKRARGTSARKAYSTSGELWMSTFDLVSAGGCEEAFDFANSGFKTSLKITNCYAENCGSGFRFQNMQYSELGALGADHIARPLVNPYNVNDVNPYGKAYGNPASSRGVYDFINCRGNKIGALGTENSWANGAIRNVASELSVQGIRVYNLHSSYGPPDGTFGVGPFVAWTESCCFDLHAVSIEGYTQHVAAAGQIYFCGFNFSQADYGSRDFHMVQLFSGRVGTWANGIFGGRGDTSYCRDYMSKAA